jgi:hypothetical protein
MRIAPQPLLRTLPLVAAAALAACADDGGGNNPVSDAGLDVADVGNDVASDAVSDVSDGADTDLHDATDVGDGDADGSGPFGIADGCNPLAWEQSCFFPWPSDGFRVEDPSLPGGHRVVVDGAALLFSDRNGNAVDFFDRHPTDGFGVHPMIAARFAEGVDEEPLVFHTEDVANSLLASSPTLLLDAETLEPVLHFAELDYSTSDPSQRLLFIRPLVRLENDHRYIVALHDLIDIEGNPIEAPAGFRELRDATATEPALAALAARYDADVFGPIAEFGVERSELQLAWDFTTETWERTHGRMITIREDAIERLEATPPVITVVSDGSGDAIDPAFADYVWRHVEGTLRVPAYVDNETADTELRLDETGAPYADGTVEVPFTLIIPHTAHAAALRGESVRLLQYGHGFFGDRTEIIGGVQAEVATALGAAMICIEWWGMSSDDAGQVALNITTDPSNIFQFIDRLHQGMVNQIAVTYAGRSTLRELDAAQVEDRPIWEPNDIYFIGNSQGHILGGVYVAMSPHIERAVLGVGGASFTFMMSRAGPFRPFLAMISLVARQKLEQQQFVAMAASSMDIMDPISWAPELLTPTLSSTPESRRILMHEGISDAQVPNLAHELHARTLGVPQLEPVVYPIDTLETISAPVDGSAVVQYDFGIEPVDTYALIPSTGNRVHEGVRAWATAQEQASRFLRAGGLIEHLCGDEACFVPEGSGGH